MPVLTHLPVIGGVSHRVLAEWVHKVHERHVVVVGPSDDIDVRAVAVPVAREELPPQAQVLADVEVGHGHHQRAGLVVELLEHRDALRLVGRELHAQVCCGGRGVGVRRDPEEADLVTLAHVFDVVPLVGWDAACAVHILVAAGRVHTPDVCGQRRVLRLAHALGHPDLVLLDLEVEFVVAQSHKVDAHCIEDLLHVRAPRGGQREEGGAQEVPGHEAEGAQARGPRLWSAEVWHRVAEAVAGACLVHPSNKGVKALRDIVPVTERVAQPQRAQQSLIECVAPRARIGYHAQYLPSQLPGRV
mmetsp:Transcript_8106/g.23778  ORF Transcript_8106/g.23778 Transcript_8106/m.23778 type:complete len:302 (-) Transcript_8106:589-1494(-)